MAEGDRVDIFEEVNPPVLAHSQPPPMHAPPPPTTAGILPAYSGAPPTHLPPPTSPRAPLPPVSLTSSASNDQARITALEGTVNQMAANMAELLALFRGPNRASSSSTPPPGQGPTIDPTSRFASPTHFFPDADVEQERRLKRMEETIRALQASDAWLDARYGDCSLFPRMRLPPKFKIPEFKTYEGTTDPRHHLRHYKGKILQYWEYEDLSGSALDWFMSLRAEDIPTWEDLSQKFIDQYRYCAEAPPTLLELSTKEMAQGQRFEEYATKWRAQAAKHIPPISEAQQIQLFHSTLRGVYYSHLLAHTSSFSDLIEAGKKLDLGIKLGRMEGPAKLLHRRNRTLLRRDRRPAARRADPANNTRRCLLLSLIYISNSWRAIEFSRYPWARISTRPLKISLSTASIIRARRGILSTIVGGCVTRSRGGLTATGSPLTPSSPRMCRPTPPDHRPSSGPSINMIAVCVSRKDEDAQDNPLPFVIDYTSEEPIVGFIGHVPSPAPFIVDILARKPYSDSKVPWTYEGNIGSVEQQFSVMGVTRSVRVYENPAAKDKGKAPAAEVEAAPENSPFSSKKVTEEEAEAFMKIVKASEYKVVEQMAKSPAHISLLALLLGSEPHREALLQVLTVAKVPKETPPDRIEETIGSIFSNTISFLDDELPSEGWSHSRALHIVCKCNNYIIGRVMIDNGAAHNICPVTTLKQMNVDLNRVRPSKTAVQAFDGSRKEVNGEINLLIDVDPCSYSITFQVLDIPNAFSLLLERPWIHSAGVVPSSLHQRLKFIVEEKLITVKGEEDYALYKETASGPSRTDRMIGKVLLRNNYILGSGLGAHGQGINRPIEIEEYKHRRGLGFRPSCHEIIKARRGNHLHRLAAHYGRLNRGTPVPPLSHFFPGSSHTIGGTLDGLSSDSDDTPATPSAVYAVTEKIPSGVHIHLAQENEELNN
ncbi:hypothetical protein CRG98_042292 [Punica granatum]|uniref:G-patch domain-containing protein n=1 Tax=Punica granatum TaxID=22663 RepID=A0A2I0I015_PUNGR|nr:hypothetical protein CRG98_042292 [Punica granatum]